MATSRSRARRRPAKDPRSLSREELESLIVDSQRKIDVIEAFETSEEWKVLSQYLDGRLKRLENEGKGLRRRVMRPIVGQPAVTLEAIASHEARLDENAILRRLPTTILAVWRGQIEELHSIRAEAAR